MDNIKKFLAIMIGAALTAIWAPAGPISATSGFRCAIQTFDKEYAASRAVFVGKVIGESRDGDSRTFEFEVETYWKGEDRGEVDVTVHENPRFQAQFSIGGRFLVFAKDNGEGRLEDGRCSRSKDLDRFPEGATEDLEKLGKGKTPTSRDDATGSSGTQLFAGAANAAEGIMRFTSYLAGSPGTATALRS